MLCSSQPILRFESCGDIFLGDIGDVFGDEGFDFHFEAVGEHFFDFLLPLLVLGEPGVGGDLLGSGDVAVVEGDFDIVGEAAAFVVDGADAEELCVGDGEALGLEGEGDGALLDDGVDVVSPGVAVEEAVDWEVVFLVEPVEHSADASGGLARAFGEDAVV